MFFRTVRKTGREIGISTAKPKSGQAHKMVSSLRKEMSLCEATCALTANLLMLLGALLNNTTNVDAK
jgi:hypothetical protein